MRHLVAIAAAFAVASVTGCDLAPHYMQPEYAVPDTYQGAGPWQIAHPLDHIQRGFWWTDFGNATLNDLETQVPKNPDILAEREAYLQARELAAEAESALYPQIGLNNQLSQNRQSPQRLTRSFTSTSPLVEPSAQIDAQASWEIDFWQQITNQARARKGLAQAEAANLASLELSLQAELANSYIALRGLDQQAQLLRQTVGTYETALSITRSRLAGKIGSALDVDRAQTQLSTSRGQLEETLAQRALALHAIADLIGVSATGFTLPPQQDSPLKVPHIPTGLPSELLQRRPDIAAAERDMAAANAEIGVARAAFYPNVSLYGLSGIETAGIDVFNLPERMWSIGSAIDLPVFEGGLRRAELGFADSAYRQTRDSYRAIVLGAFRDVEDQLSLNDYLAKESIQDAQAARSSAQAQQLSMQMYVAGATNYLEVVVAQIAAFQAANSGLSIDIRVQQAAINLIRALGGGWSAELLPPEEAILPFDPLKPPFGVRSGGP